MAQYAEKKIKEKHTEKSKKINTNDLTQEDYLKNPLFSDSSLRSMLLSEYLNKTNKQDSYKGNKKNFYENYKENILQVRNKLAHAQKIVDNDGQEKLKTKDGTVIFDKERCIKLRSKINEMFNLINNLHVLKTE